MTFGVSARLHHFAVKRLLLFLKIYSVTIGAMESDEIEVPSKSGMNIRNDKNTVIDYDEDRVRLEFISCVCVCSVEHLRIYVLCNNVNYIYIYLRKYKF